MRDQSRSMCRRRTNHADNELCVTQRHTQRNQVLNQQEAHARRVLGVDACHARRVLGVGVVQVQVFEHGLERPDGPRCLGAARPELPQHPSAVVQVQVVALGLGPYRFEYSWRFLIYFYF